ncbi:MAG: stage III sporulation protein AD [Oscillospiraceae bacterium]|nr:stage III sporulation protein AD [Oscillospiraceae bacterium]
MVTAMQAAGIALTAVMLAKMLERYAKEQAMLLTLLTGALLTAAAVTMMTPVTEQIDALLSNAGLEPQQTACITKAIGICCVTQLASDVCKDAGESAMASAVMIAGKTALLVLTLPLILPLRQILEEVLSCAASFG